MLWLSTPQAVVRDVRGLGVMYAPQLRSFTCLSGPREAIQQRASLPELAALLQVRVDHQSVQACAVQPTPTLASMVACQRHHWHLSNQSHASAAARPVVLLSDMLCCCCAV
jgi:hypothetical protein